MQTSYNKENVIYAGFFSRLSAFLLDTLLVSLGLLVMKVVVWILSLSIGDSVIFKPILFQFTFFDILYYLITVGYFVIGTYCYSTTVGKYLMNLKVVDKDGEKLTFMTVLIRETVGRYLAELIVCVGYLMIGCDRFKQGLHDKIADTCVIHAQMTPARTATISTPPMSMPMEQRLTEVPSYESAVSEEEAETGVQEPATAVSLTKDNFSDN